MAYHLRRTKTVKTDIVNTARSQIDKAIAEIDDKELNHHEVVHQVRKRCKKLRPVFPDYKKENSFFRDAAGELSSVRDAQSIIECFDDLAEYYENMAGLVHFEPIRRHLIDRRAEIADNTDDLGDRLKTFRIRMVEARARVKKWKITDEGFDAVAEGFMKTYKRGRKTFSKAYEKPSAENFHEWRKRVKYHWYHCRLLREIWPEMLKVHRKTANDLADLLGDDHDLAVLKETLEKESQLVVKLGDCDDENLGRIFVLIDERRSGLQHQAQFLGERLYAEQQKHIAKRFGSYWMSWRR
jgi:CHAD domain-containing protein